MRTQLLNSCPIKSKGRIFGYARCVSACVGPKASLVNERVYCVWCVWAGYICHGGHQPKRRVFGSHRQSPISGGDAGMLADLTCCRDIAKSSSFGPNTKHGSSAGVLSDAQQCVASSRSVAIKFKTEHKARQAFASSASGYGSVSCAVFPQYTATQANFGENLKVVGSSDALGGWDVSKSPSMTWTDGDVWCLDLVLQAGEHVHFKAGLRQFLIAMLSGLFISTVYRLPLAYHMVSRAVCKDERRLG